MELEALAADLGRIQISVNKFLCPVGTKRSSAHLSSWIWGDQGSYFPHNSSSFTSFYPVFLFFPSLYSHMSILPSFLSFFLLALFHSFFFISTLPSFYSIQLFLSFLFPFLFHFLSFLKAYFLFFHPSSLISFLFLFPFSLIFIPFILPFCLHSLPCFLSSFILFSFPSFFHPSFHFINCAMWCQLWRQ